MMRIFLFILTAVGGFYLGLLQAPEPKFTIFCPEGQYENVLEADAPLFNDNGWIEFKTEDGPLNRTGCQAFLYER